MSRKEKSVESLPSPSDAKPVKPATHFSDTTTKIDNEVPISEVVGDEEGAANLLGSGAPKEV